MIKGVVSVEPGYAIGKGDASSLDHAPSYEEICTGETNYVEVAKIEYDPAQTKLRDLLTVFFASHDPTTLNRQGNDIGTQYRSAIFYENEEQKAESEKIIEEINNSTTEGDRVATEVAELDKFYPAEDYHKDYFAKNPDKGYCAVVIAPKVAKIQKEFAELLNK